MTPVLFNFPLIHRCDGAHVELRGTIVLLILHGII